MFYIIIFIAIAFAAQLQIFSKKEYKYTFMIFSFALTLLSIIRFGSGTDYFAYAYHYGVNADSIIESVSMQTNMNIGYRVIMGVFKSLGIGFDIFVFVISMFIMILYLSIINNNSKARVLSLFALFAIYYEIYVNSAMRQGLAMAIVFYALFKYFQRGKNIQYLILVLLAVTFHPSSLIMIAAPIIKFMYKRTFNLAWFNISIFILAIGFYFFRISRLIVTVANLVGIDIVYQSSEANYLSILLRLVFLMLIYILYKNNKSTSITEFEKVLIYIYYVGSLLFIAISDIQMFSRVLEYFTLLEIVLIPNLIINIKDVYSRIAIYYFFVVLVGVIFVKDLASFTEQSDYKRIGATEYRYVTIFNKADILEYRNILPEIQQQYISDK